MKTVLILLVTFISLNVFGQSQWITQNPKQTIRDVKIIDENTAIRVGDDGIFKTTNGGDEWIEKWSEDIWGQSKTQYLTKVFFINDSTGWVVNGKNATILKTIDAGENWAVVAQLPGFLIKDIFFTEEEFGWLVGKEGDNRNYPYYGHIYKTTDGGVTWEQNKKNFLWDFEVIYFTSSDTGWIGGKIDEYAGHPYEGIIIKTTNNGETWFEQQINYDDLESIVSMSFFDKNNGWALGPSELDHNTEYKVLGTTDGGTNWDIKSSIDNWNPSSIIFRDENVGWIVGNGFPLVAQEEATIAKTTDRGETWATQTISNKYKLNNFYVKDSSLLFAVGTRGSILKSINDGEDWIESFSSHVIDFNSVSFSDTIIGTIVGNYGKILRTTNGGNNWYEVPSGVTNDLQSVFFLENYGWAVGGKNFFSSLSNGRNILKTTNAGEDWTIIHSDSATSLGSIYFLNENLGWTVGGYGTILKTTNGGEDWMPQSSGTIRRLNSVFFVDSLTGWAVGSHGYPEVLKTTDSGENWENVTINIPLNIDLNSVFFIDSLTGWIVGNSCFIFKTTDGGINWVNQPFNSIYDLTSVFFTTSLKGWATVSDGYLLHTEDGGENWFGIGTGFTNDMKSVYFYDTNSGYAVGDGGIIKKYISNSAYDIPSVVELLYPGDGAEAMPLNLSFEWEYSKHTKYYRLQLSFDSVFSNIIHDIDSIVTTSQNISDLMQDTTYYWRVNASNELGTSNWSEVWYFKTKVHSFNAQNWIIQNSNSSKHLSSVCFINPDVGWISSGTYWAIYSNTYLKTSDGGKRWVPQETALEKIGDLCFLDERLGFAVNSEGFAGRQYAMTIDGGNNWVKFGADTSYNSYKISFPSKDVGYSVVSSNGFGPDPGHKTIKKVNLKYLTSQFVQNPGFGESRANYLDIDFLNKNCGWVVGYDLSNDYFFKNSFIYKTKDAGQSWDLQFEVVANWDSLNTDYDYLYFYDVDAIDTNNVWVCGRGESGIIMNSMDGGNTWEIKFKSLIPSTSTYPVRLSFSDPMHGSVIFRNISSNGANDYLLQTFDGGETWHPQYFNLFASLHDIQMVDSTTGYVVGNDGLVLKFQDTTTVVGIANEEMVLPDQYELSQNYPNPFNPETTIKFSLPKNSKVVLEIYNILGQRVRELINKDLSAGYHDVKFNSAGLASGVYICRMQADGNSGKNKNGFMEVKKMILLK